MIYLTSDTFFGRSSKATERGFEDSEQMLDAMVANWNSTVKPNDIVYHLGNFAWDIISAEQALMQLNGHINLMPSTYDSGFLAVSENFSDVHVIDSGVFVVPELNIVLSPWVLSTWPGKSSGSLHVHGGDKRYKANIHKENRFNSNCELWGLRPITLESLNAVIEMVKETKE